MSDAIYIASRASIPERSAMWRQFRDSGIDITSSWIDEAGAGETADFGELWARIMNEIALVASKRQRAPTNEDLSRKFGINASMVIGKLCRDGHLRSEVYGRNYRVLELKTGPFAGNRTAECPHGGTPYKVMP